MALINCSECGKEVSDKAASCPNCGNLINKKEEKQEEFLCCPKCRSKELHSEHKGFSGGKALAGAVITGGIGLLAGTIGSKDVQVTCLKCGNKFKAGESLVVKPQDNDHIEQDIIEIIKSGNMLMAVKAYRDRSGVSLSEAKLYVDNLKKTHNIIPSITNNSGCAGVIAIIILVVSGSIIAFI